mgnify:CR=1 FL=1
MANIRAVQNGDWSDTATWLDGVKPGTGDDVFSNNFTVQIDEDVEVLSLRNTAATPIVQGGSFVLHDGVTLKATGSGLVPVASLPSLVSFSDASPDSEAWVEASVINITTAATHATVLHSGAGRLNVVAGEILGANNTSSGSVGKSGSGDLHVTGVLRPSGNVSAPVCIFSTSTGGEVVCNFTSSTVAVGGNSPCVRVEANAVMGRLELNCVSEREPTDTGTVLFLQGIVSELHITGVIKAGISEAVSTNAIQVPEIRATGQFRAGSTGAALFIMHTVATPDFLVDGEFESGPTGRPALMANYFKVASSSFGRSWTYRTENPVVDKTYYDAGHPSSDFPEPSNVRHGTVYADDSMVGTCHVPTPEHVAYGVPVDDTVGTALLDQASVVAAIWGADTRTLTEGGGGGEADWTAEEREQIRYRLGIDGDSDEPEAEPNLGAGGGLDAEGVRAALGMAAADLDDQLGALATSAEVAGLNDISAGDVRTELATELARIDAAISSRSTYGGGDTAGTTTLLDRLTSGRAGNLDNLDAAVSTRSSHGAADVWSVGTRTLTGFGSLVSDIAAAVWGSVTRTLTAAADSSGVTTLLGRLTAGRAGYLDKLNVSGTLAHSNAADTYKADVSDLATSSALDAAESSILDAIGEIEPGVDVPALSSVVGQLLSDALSD